MRDIFSPEFRKRLEMETFNVVRWLLFYFEEKNSESNKELLEQFTLIYV